MIVMLASGLATAFPDGLRYVAQNLREYKVSLFVGVPLLVEAIYRNIEKEVEKKERVDKEIKTYTIEQSKERLNNLISDYPHRQAMAREEQRRQKELNKLDKQFNQDLFNQHQQQKRPEIKPSNQLTLSFPIIQPKDKKEWLKSNLPYLSPNKVKNLYFNKFGKSDISLNEINKETEHFNDFNIKDSQKKYSLKTYSNVYHSFIGDIFFNQIKQHSYY